MIDVVAGVIIKDNLILVARRAGHKHLGGFWEFPGGKVEQSESQTDALCRELDEELALHVRVGKKIEESIFQYETKKIRLIGFWCEWLSGEPRLEDHDSVQWLEVHELSSLRWAPADIPIVDAVLVSGIPHFVDFP